jgi:TRAP-type C4-dicarboxylate transport system substrate-binding protein
MGRKLVRDMNTDLIKQLEDDPAKKVYRLSDAEKAAFAKAAASVHDQFPSKSSARGAELLKKVKAAKK